VNSSREPGGTSPRAPWPQNRDIATIRYEPAGPGSGIAYLGYAPGTYFADESASEPADVLRDADGLALWVTRRQGRNDTPELRELIASFLAGGSREQQSGEHGDDLDDTDIFVEVKVSRFLMAVGLPAHTNCPVCEDALFCAGRASTPSGGAAETSGHAAGPGGCGRRAAPLCGRDELAACWKGAGLMFCWPVSRAGWVRGAGRVWPG